MSFKDAVEVSATGLHARSLRMRVIAENLANSDSLATTPGGRPYQRRVATFQTALDRATGAQGVRIRSITADKAPFSRVYAPGTPAADSAGYVLRPNVDGLIEAADMKAAQRAYEANLNAIEAARGMAARTLDVLR